MNTRYEFNEDNVDQLNSFLRGELSAVETYRQAIDKVEEDPSLRGVLERCKASHQTRADMLSTQITRLGGEPTTGSGVWGSFAKLAEGGAKLFGKKAAVSMLEEGEDHGLADYRRDLDDLDTPVRMFVENEILPAQRKTHAEMSALQSAM